MPSTPAANVRLTDAQRRALANPTEPMHANTRRALVSKGYLDAQGRPTDAGRAIVGQAAPSTADTKLSRLLETENPAAPRTKPATAAPPTVERGVVGRVANANMRWMDMLSPEEAATWRNAKDLGDSTVMADIRKVAQDRMAGKGRGAFASQAAQQAREVRAERALPGQEARVASSPAGGLGAIGDDTLALQRANFPERFARDALARQRVARLESIGATGPEMDLAGRTIVGNQGQVVDMARSTRPEQLPWQLETAPPGPKNVANRLPTLDQARRITAEQTPGSFARGLASQVDPAAGGRMGTFTDFVPGQETLPGVTPARPTPSVGAIGSPTGSSIKIPGQMTLDEALGLAQRSDLVPTTAAQTPAPASFGTRMAQSAVGAPIEAPGAGGRLLAGELASPPITPRTNLPAPLPISGELPASTIRPSSFNPLPQTGNLGGFGTSEPMNFASAAARQTVPPAGAGQSFADLTATGDVLANAAGGAAGAARGGFTGALNALPTKIIPGAGRFAGLARGALPALPGLAASMIGGQIVEHNPDTEGFDVADVGQGLQSGGLIASIGAPAAVALGAGPVGWGVLGAVALGAGIYSALQGKEDPQDRMNKVVAAAQKMGLPWDDSDQRRLEGTYDMLIAQGIPEEDAAAEVAQQVVTAAQSYDPNAAAGQMTPELYMALQGQYQKALADSQAYYGNIADTATQSRLQELGQQNLAPSERTTLAGMTNAARERSAYTAWASQLAALSAPTLDMYQQQIDQQNLLAQRANSKAISQTLGGGGAGGIQDLLAAAG